MVMPRFYIEIPHEEEKLSCLRAIKVLQETGSHFLTNAEYGCLDGDHTARIFVEVDNKQDALTIVPRAYRRKARVVKINRFSEQQIDELLKHHGG
jgi:hypothetical protein